MATSEDIKMAVDTTMIVGVAGIAGTLGGTLWAGSRQSKAVREDRILERRLDSYVVVVDTVMWEAEDFEAVHDRDIQVPNELSDSTLRSVQAELHAFGSRAVVEAFRSFHATVQAEHASVADGHDPDEAVERVRDSAKLLIEAVRKETAPGAAPRGDG